MIELTEAQIRAIEGPTPGRPHLVNPRTKEAFVLLPVDEYKRLTADAYDDSPWTREELQALAWETTNRAAWEGEDDDDGPEKP